MTETPTRPCTCSGWPHRTTHNAAGRPGRCQTLVEQHQSPTPAEAAGSDPGSRGSVRRGERQAHLWPGDDDRTRPVIGAILGASADQVRTDEVL